MMFECHAFFRNMCRITTETLVKRFVCHNVRVKASLQAAYVLRLEQRGTLLEFCLHDLKTGRRYTFSCWRALEKHVEAANVRRLH